MSDQGKLTTSGDIEFIPRTWDGEPLYSPATVAEGLFDTSAFKQMPGQTALETDEPAWTLTLCGCCRNDFYSGQPLESYCPDCLEG